MGSLDTGSVNGFGSFDGLTALIERIRALLNPEEAPAANLTDPLAL